MIWDGDNDNSAGGDDDGDINKDFSGDDRDNSENGDDDDDNNSDTIEDSGVGGDDDGEDISKDGWWW